VHRELETLGLIGRPAPGGWPKGPISHTPFPSAKTDGKAQHDTAPATCLKPILRVRPVQTSVNPARIKPYAREGRGVRAGGNQEPTAEPWALR